MKAQLTIYLCFFTTGELLENLVLQSSGSAYYCRRVKSESVIIPQQSFEIADLEISLLWMYDVCSFCLNYN